jgi:hypothetical protein
MISVLPSSRLVLRSRLAPPEVHARLVGGTKPFAAPTLSWKALTQRDPRPFTGKVFESSFEIARQINYRNSFLPICKGTLARDGDGTRVEVKLAMHDFVVVFMALWLTAAGGAGLVGLSLLAHADPTGLFLLVFPAFGLALPRVGFALEEKKTRAALAHLIDATEAAS